MAGIEGLTVDGWLYATLTGDAQLMALVTDVFPDDAPPAAAFPYVIFTQQSPVLDTRGVAGARVLGVGRWTVKVVVDGAAYGKAAAAVARVDALLQGATDPAAGVLGVTRFSEFRYPELRDGRHYRHLGGIYEVTVA